jgi:hypothetical protein
MGDYYQIQIISVNHEFFKNYSDLLQKFEEAQENYYSLFS